jgi:uncharacterized protein YkwD
MPTKWLLPCLLLAALAAPVPARAFELPCRHEDVLAETAANFLLSGAPLESSRLLPEARALGFDGVAIHAHEGSDDAALVAWLKTVSDRADGPLVCGEAASETRRLVLVSVRGGHLRLAGRIVYGELEPGFSKPELVFEASDGEISRAGTSRERLAGGVALPDGVHTRKVQLIAEGPSGPRPVAELALDAQARRPSLAAPAPNPAETRGPRSRSVETLLARIDGFRRGKGVGTLRQNELLSHSAQRHAERVCELGRVAHRLDQGDDPETRLREEHIEARAVGEAVARADSADAALAAVFESPSHRDAVAERRFTDAGIGQALDQKGHTCLVVLLASWPRRIP